MKVLKMKKITAIVMLTCFLFVGCSTHIHTIDDGPQTGESHLERQWYALFGLVALNEVDVDAMADGAANYEIQTQVSFVDGIINVFTGIISVSCKSVKVTK